MSCCLKITRTLFQCTGTIHGCAFKSPPLTLTLLNSPEQHLQQHYSIQPGSTALPYNPNEQPPTTTTTMNFDRDMLSAPGTPMSMDAESASATPMHYFNAPSDDIDDLASHLQATNLDDKREG
jgi:hypothetical protein